MEGQTIREDIKIFNQETTDIKINLFINLEILDRPGTEGEKGITFAFSNGSFVEMQSNMQGVPEHQMIRVYECIFVKTEMSHGQVDFYDRMFRKSLKWDFEGETSFDKVNHFLSNYLVKG